MASGGGWLMCCGLAAFMVGLLCAGATLGLTKDYSHYEHYNATLVAAGTDIAGSFQTPAGRFPHEFLLVAITVVVCGLTTLLYAFMVARAQRKHDSYAKYSPPNFCVRCFCPLATAVGLLGAALAVVLAVQANAPPHCTRALDTSGTCGAPISPPGSPEHGLWEVLQDASIALAGVQLVVVVLLLRVGTWVWRTVPAFAPEELPHAYYVKANGCAQPQYIVYQ